MPNLRFPEFKDAPGWEEKPFGDLYAFKPTNTLSRDKLNYEGGTVRNIHYGDIHTRFQTLFDVRREHVPFVANEIADDFDDNSLCTEGDLVFADASEDLNDVGKSIEIVALHGERVLSGTHTILATRRGAQLIVGFGGYLFRSDRMRQQIRKESQGSKVYGISSGRLENLKVCFPAKVNEQRKIAACLTSLDEWIAAEGRKLEALQAHKKGLMQQLFPREGETHPRRRFPEFRDRREWEGKRIGELLEKVSFPIDVQADKTYCEIGVRSHGKGIFHKNEVKGSTIGTKRVFRVVEDAFVLNIIFAWEQAVAFTTKAEAGMIASHRFPMFLPKSNACDVRFIKLALLTPAGKHLLGVASPGGAGRNRTLGQDEFEKMEIVVPDKDEQAKIADAVLGTEALLTAQSRKLDGLRTHRKSLMQQLFPSPERV
jgi:type I restriction enzyme, S subunit